MSNPYENHPGKGFKYIPGYEPPAGTQAAEEKRRLEEEKRRKEKENSDAINDAIHRQSETEARNRRHAQAERAQKKAATQKTKKTEKEDDIFSESAATITFIIVGFYTYGEWNYEIFQAFITAVISALIVGYTIKIIFTLLVIGFFAYLIAEYNGYVYEGWLGEVIEVVFDNIAAFIDHLSGLGTRD